MTNGRPRCFAQQRLDLVKEPFQNRLVKTMNRLGLLHQMRPIQQWLLIQTEIYAGRVGRYGRQRLQLRYIRHRRLRFTITPCRVRGFNFPELVRVAWRHRSLLPSRAFPGTEFLPDVYFAVNLLLEQLTKCPSVSVYP